MDANDRLDVEDEDERRRRIETLLERTNNSASLTNAPAAGSSLVFPMSVDNHESPHPIDPSSELLERVRNFLPQLADSNAALAQQAPDAIDIENVGEDQEHYVEMNLGLGVFEYRGKPPNPEISSSSDSDTKSESSSNDSSSDSESSTEISLTACSSRPMKPLPKRNRPVGIVVIGETSTPTHPSGSANQAL